MAYEVQPWDPLDDIAPSGNKIDIYGQAIVRLKGSKITEKWESFDELVILR